VVTISCPACRGTSHRELTPGFYECTSVVDASMPPGMAGNAGWLHGSRPCGHRFQAGLGVATEPCWCGRHSIGSCCDCKRPLCGLHGTEGGELLCGDCVAARIERRQAMDAAAVAARKRSLEAEGRDLSANLDLCSSGAELLELLCARAEAVPDRNALCAAWVQVISSDTFDATHEVVILAGRPMPRSPLTWNDFKWRGSWSESEQRSIVWRAPEAGYKSDLGHTNIDVWIDVQGNVWRGVGSTRLGFGKNDGPKTCYYVLERGERLRLKRGDDTYQTFHTVPGGVPVEPTSPSDATYAHVIEVALKHAL
jgi:hypothetical protein